jgi:hypothetical protein
MILLGVTLWRYLLGGALLVVAVPTMAWLLWEWAKYGGPR